MGADLMIIDDPIKNRGKRIVKRIAEKYGMNGLILFPPRLHPGCDCYFDSHKMA